MPELTSEQYGLAFTVLIIYSIITYIIIRAAVGSGNFKNTKHLHEQLRISNRLKIIELKKLGVTQDEIDKAVEL
jgi:hypothetical protein